MLFDDKIQKCCKETIYFIYELVIDVFKNYEPH